MKQIQEMENLIEGMRPLFEQVQWQDPMVYATWLSQARFIAHRSTAFLGLCLFHSHEYPAFQKRCTEHIGEETGHERLIDNDLKRIGIALQPEMPETMAVYRPQYFQIVGVSPLSFVGYVFMLELLAPAYGQYVIERTKSAGVSFLKVHSSADEDHIGKATQIFETLPERERALALDNFRMTHVSYVALVQKLRDMSLRSKAAA